MATKKTGPKKANKPKSWNAAEVLMAFTGFLAMRKEPLIFSGQHDASPIAEITGAFIAANKLPNPRSRYPKLKVPDNTDHITNVINTKSATVSQPTTANQALGQMYSAMIGLDSREQDVAIAAFLDQMKTQRLQIMNTQQQRARNISLDARKAEDSVLNLEKIAHGDYAVLYPRTLTNTANADNG